MKIFNLVIALIFGVFAWVCTQLNWQYANIIFYIALFIASWFVCLVFLYQDESETSKKYTVITPSNLIYVVIIAIIIFSLRKYNIKEYATVRYSFYKVVAIVNAVQGAVIVLYYKFRDIYYHA